MIYYPKRFLITGGCGFIGSNFIHYLAKNSPDAIVINLDKLGYGADLKNLKDLPSIFNYTFVQGDITDKNLVHELLTTHEIDTIVHFAAESHVDRSITDPASFLHSNVVGTYVMLEAAREVWQKKHQCDASQCLFYHISTDEVFGSLSLSDPAFTEATPYAPNSPYSATKAGSDHLVRAYYHTFNLPMVMSNCSNNYGPRQYQEKFIPTIIRSCLNNQRIPVYGDGSNIRDWLFVEDHCRAIDLIIQKGVRGETYNVGGNSEKNNLQVVEALCTLLDQKYPRKEGSYQALVEFVKDRAGHDWRYAINAEKLMRLDWMPQENFSSGLEKTVDWYLQTLLLPFTHAQEGKNLEVKEDAALG